ncbi:MAG: hypothetical protein ACLUVV_05135 [Christensenellales bacterium]
MKVPFKVACGLGVTLCGLLIVSLSGGSGANPLSTLMLTAALDIPYRCSSAATCAPARTRAHRAFDGGAVCGLHRDLHRFAW